MSDFDQVMRDLDKMRSAAPPVAAAKLTSAMRLLQGLQEENMLLGERLTEALISGVPSDAALTGDSLHVPPLPPGLVPIEQRMGDTNQLDPGVADTNKLHDGTLLPSMGDIISRIHRALRPALRTIREQVSSIAAGTMGRLNTEQIEALRLAQDSAALGERLLDSVQMMLGLRENKVRPEPAVFEPLSFVRDARALVNDFARSREHRILLSADEKLPDVEGDYGVLIVIMTDLLDNAIRYTPVGGQIRLSADTLGTHVLFSVADSGIGLTAEDASHVGEPFWRAMHQPMVRQHPGTGLRVFLARHLVELQGGEFFFSGEPNLGCTFSFTLPAAP